MSNQTNIDGIEMDGDTVTSAKLNPGLATGYKFKYLGQTGNTAAGNVANQEIGTVALPALAAGATGTVTITNSLITTASLITVGTRRGTTTAAAGALAAIVATAQPPAAGSCVFDLRNVGTAATLSTDVEMWYRISN